MRWYHFVRQLVGHQQAARQTERRPAAAAPPDLRNPLYPDPTTCLKGGQIEQPDRLR
jgi:hypothetical protein